MTGTIKEVEEKEGQGIFGEALDWNPQGAIRKGRPRIIWRSTGTLKEQEEWED